MMNCGSGRICWFNPGPLRSASQSVPEQGTVQNVPEAQSFVTPPNQHVTPGCQ